MSNLLDPGFWFDVTPLRLSPVFEIGFFVLFALCIMAALVLRIMRKNRTDKFEAQILAKSSALGLTMGILGLLWLFFSFEEISYFGMRVWILVWGIIVFVWAAKIYRYATKEAPMMRLAEQSKAEANKYLPRSNRR